MTPVGVALAALACLVGASLQRSTGMGFAIVSAPFLVLMVGPVEGVVLANLASVATAGFSAWRMRSQLDGPRARWLIPCGILGCLPGALLVRSLPAAWVGLVVSLVMLLALVVSLRAPSGHLRDTPMVRAVAGAVGGFMNTTAGVAGPALAVYQRSTGWEQPRFAATAPATFAVLGAVSALLKGRWPAVPWWGLVTLAAATALGLVVGGRLHGRLDPARATRLVMWLALLGTVAGVVKAALALSA